MRDLNKVMLIGNLTRDPELRTIPSGQSVCSLTIAVNRSWTNSTGARQDAVEYVDVVTWGKLAELVSQTLHKGRKVYIEGRLQTHSWDAPDGSKRFKTEVIASDVIFLDRPKTLTGETFAPAAPAPESQVQPEATPPAEEGEINLDNISF
jgi:single-strand DNA-binding protein